MTDKISRYDNVMTKIADGVLTITILVDETEVDVQPSKSGKTVVLATTGGARKIEHSPLRLNLTVYRKP